MCHSTLEHHCPMQHYRSKKRKKKRLVSSHHCVSHIIQDLVEGWEPLAINLFCHNLSIALPTAGSVHALSNATATLILLHTQPAILPPSHPSTPSTSPFPLTHVHTSSPNAQHPLPLHFHSSYRLSLVFPNHAIFQFQFSILLSFLSTLPIYVSASYSQSLHIETYIHNPLTFQSLPVLIDPKLPLSKPLSPSSML